MTVPLESLDGDGVHIVLLGDSTLDNGRYLNLARGELSVEKQLNKKCMERGWEMTVLAQDGSLLDDVRQRQLPLIPECATHIVMSASGNDLLSLLNQMVVANFTLGSVYEAIGSGLQQVADNYRDILQELKGLGCHLACCTVYRPNFNHLFFKSLATFSLGLHNGRIKQISVDLDCSIIDFASMFDCHEDFANPLELSTRGGSKLVENVGAFVADHPISMLSRRVATNIYNDDDAFLPGSVTRWGIPMRCCATRAAHRKVYDSKAVSKGLETPEEALAGGNLGPALVLAEPEARNDEAPRRFSQAQEQWRNTETQPPAPGLRA